MKGWVIALFIIAGIIILAYIIILMIIRKLTFKFRITGIDFSQINLPLLLSGQTQQLNLNLNLAVCNKNTFSIPFKNIHASLYYENVLIAETTDSLKSQTLILPPIKDGVPGRIEISDNVNVNVNSTLIKLIRDTAIGQHPRVDYTVILTVFGIPFSYSDYFDSSNNTDTQTEC